MPCPSQRIFSLKAFLERIRKPVSWSTQGVEMSPTSLPLHDRHRRMCHVVTPLVGVRPPTTRVASVSGYVLGGHLNNRMYSMYCILCCLYSMCTNHHSSQYTSKRRTLYQCWHWWVAWSPEYGYPVQSPGLPLARFLGAEPLVSLLGLA